MIIDLIAIFRARKDPPLATRLAAKFAQSQAFDRLTAPLFVVHLAMWVVITISSVLVIGTLWLVFTWHEAAFLLGLLPGALLFLSLKIEVGLRKGMERIRIAAESMTDRGLDRVLKKQAEEAPETNES